MEFSVKRIKRGFIACFEAIEKSSMVYGRLLGHRAHIIANGPECLQSRYSHLSAKSLADHSAEVRLSRAPSVCAISWRSVRVSSATLRGLRSSNLRATPIFHSPFV